MKELSDNEIRVIGDGGSSVGSKQPRRPWLMAIVALAALALLAAALWAWHQRVSEAANEPGVLFDSTTVVSSDTLRRAVPMPADTAVGVELIDTMVNDIPLRVLVPHGLLPSLHVGHLTDGPTDSVMMALQAADVRADNKEIVGACVVRGEMISRGTAKQGFCAIIDGEITLGVDVATPFFELAIDRKGDFFRQYPLVKDGRLVENQIKNKALRRALAVVDGRMVVVMTSTRESLHDFSQALVDIGATNAINLVGGRMSSGWVAAGDSLIVPEPNAARVAAQSPASINYIIWSK